MALAHRAFSRTHGSLSGAWPKIGCGVLILTAQTECGARPECNSIFTPSTIVTVTDQATGRPVCGANVTAWRIWEDAAVGTTTFGGDAGDSSCTGQYGGALGSTATWTIQVTKAGYRTQTVSVDGPAWVDCAQANSNSALPQQVLVKLTPG